MNKYDDIVVVTSAFALVIGTFLVASWPLLASWQDVVTVVCVAAITNLIVWAIYKLIALFWGR